MPRHRRLPGVYAGPKLTTMLLLLGIVGLLIYRSSSMSQPNNAAAMTSTIDEPESKLPENVPPTNKPAGNPAKPGIVYDEFSTRAAEKGKTTPDEDRIDLDPEERKQLKVHSEMLVDGSLSIAENEMFAYERLLNWVDDLSYREIAAKVVTDWRFHDLKQTPKRMRGKPIKLELNVVRILKFEFHDKKTDSKRDLFEVWGRSTDAKEWFYVAIVPELPIGMQPAALMDEKCVLAGYFLKLQGYHEARADPAAPPLMAAPLLIGRLAWKPEPVRPALNPGELSLPTVWIWGLLGFLTLAYLVVRLRISRRPAKAALSGDIDEVKALAWLQDAEQGTARLPDSPYDHDEQEPDDETDMDFGSPNRFRNYHNGEGT